jgi:hypothetical protein
VLIQQAATAVVVAHYKGLRTYSAVAAPAVAVAAVAARQVAHRTPTMQTTDTESLYFPLIFLVTSVLF